MLEGGVVSAHLPEDNPRDMIWIITASSAKSPLTPGAIIYNEH